MTNAVKFTLAIDGGQVVITTLDGVSRSFGAMGEGGKRAGEEAAKGFDRAAESMRTARSAIDDASNRTLSFIASLERQTSLHGKSQAEALRYDAALLAVNKDQQAHIQNLIGIAEAQEQGIPKTQTAIEQMRNMAVAVGAVGLAWKAFDVAREMAMLNARYQELGVVMPVVGRNAGYTATEMNSAAESMQRAGISMLESRNTAIQLAQAQINLADASKLARIAQDAAVVGNMNSSEALASMIHGIKSGQVDVLRTIGINVNFEQSYKAMAQQLHVSTEALTEHQKMQARENAVLEEGTKLTGAYEAAMGTAGKQMRSAARYTEDLKVVLGEVFNEAVTVAVMGYTDHLKAANQETATLSANGSLKSWGEGVSNVFAFAVDSAMSVVSLLQTVGATTVWLGATVANSANRMAHPFSSTDEDQSNINAAYKQMIADIWKNVDGMRTAQDARRAALKEDADKRVAIEQDYSRRSLEVMRAYAGQSLEVQQAAQAALAKNMFPQGFPNAPKPEKANTGEHKLTEYQRLIESIKEKIRVEELDAATQEKLTAGEKLRIETYQKIDAGILKVSASRKLELDAILQELIAKEKGRIADEQATKQLVANAAARQAARNKEYDGINAYMEAQTEGYAKEVKASKDALKAAQDQYDLYGKSKSQIAEITLLLLQKRQAAQYTPGSEPWEKDQKLIEYQKQLIQVLRNTEGLEAQKDMWVSIEGAAHTTFTNILQGGQDLTTRLRESMKAGFFDWLYQMTLKRWIFSGSASMSGSAVANAAMPGMAGNAASLYSMGSSVATVGGQYIAGTMSGANAMGTIAANATGAGIDGLLATNGAFGTAAGSGAAAATAGAEAGAAAATAGAEAGASSVLGAIPGWGWAALGAVALFSIFGGDKGWAKSTGESTMQFDQAGNMTSATPHRYTDVDNSGADAAVKAMNRSYLDAAKSLGIGSVATEFAFGSSTNSDGLNRYRTGLNIGGKTVYDSGEQHADPGAVQLAASQAVLTALQSSELPKYMQGVFDGIDASKLDQNGVNAAIKSAQDLKSAYEVLGAVPGLDLTGISYQTLNGVKDAFGGVDQMNQAVSAYVASMYSDAEKTGHANDVLASNWAKLEPEMAKLGHSIPTTEAEFKALVSSIDVTTVSGANLMASVLALAPAFDASAQAARAAASNMLSAIQNWGTSSDVRAFQAQMLQKNLADSGLSLSMDQIMGATQSSALEYYQSLDPNSTAAQALLKYQQDIYTFVGGKSTSNTQGASSPGGGGGGGGGGSASSAVDQVKSALQQYTDALLGEAKRIRDQMTGTDKRALTAAQARLDIMAIQAQAGSEAALKELPALAQSVTELGKKNVSSLLEYRMLQAETADTLERTANIVAARNGLTVAAPVSYSGSAAQSASVPSVEPYVPQLPYMPPMATYNAPAAQASDGSGSSSDVVTVLNKVLTKLDEIKGFTKETSQSTDAMELILNLVAPKRDALNMRAV